jgi:NAD+ kinase
MTRVALVVNVHKKNARAACTDLLSFLRGRGVEIIADGETAELIGDGAAERDPARLRAEAELVVSIGGDGTVLKAARILEGARIPLVGINLGGLGFLTATTLDGARDLLARVLDGDHRAEERLLLKVVLRRGGEEVSSRVVLNDAVIAKGALSRLVALETFIGDEYLVTFVSDGLIISSPTGSTAYSLSAGGPLVSPDTDAIIVAPICPHTLSNRPLIVPSSTRVRVVVSGKAGDNTLTLDGQVSEALRDGDEVTVEGFGRKLLLLVSREKSYFQLLREKLHWGGRTLHG